MRKGQVRWTGPDWMQCMHHVHVQVLLPLPQPHTCSRFACFRGLDGKFDAPACLLLIAGSEYWHRHCRLRHFPFAAWQTESSLLSSMDLFGSRLVPVNIRDFCLVYLC
jgi:hypothetical protein